MRKKSPQQVRIKVFTMTRVMPLEYNAGMQAVLELCVCAAAAIAVTLTGFVFLTLVHLAQTISLIAIDSQSPYRTVQLQWNVSLVICAIWTISLDRFYILTLCKDFQNSTWTQFCGANSCGC